MRLHIVLIYLYLKIFDQYQIHPYIQHGFLSRLLISRSPLQRNVFEIRNSEESIDHYEPVNIQDRKMRIKNFPISHIISQYIDIEQVNEDRYQCVCPFHDDTNPSMHILDDRGFYHCFACSAGEIVRLWWRFGQYVPHVAILPFFFLKEFIDVHCSWRCYNICSSI